MIGHALTVAPGPAGRALWDRWIAIGFAIGSACFFIGPFPGFVQLVGEGADGVVFFAGSVFFTLAAGLELREATLRLGRWASNPSWWSAAVQFAGTLQFNLNTFDAMRDGLSTEQENRLVFAPDLFGSACFLVSGVLAYRVATGPEARMAAVNLAGCVLFGISAIASYVVPSSGSVLDLAAVNWSTALGALCFFIGALMLLPRKSPVLKEAWQMSQPDLSEQLDELATQYGNRFLLEAAPDEQLPEHGMRAVDAMRLIDEELVLDGIPMRNLATFVTTWMEPEAQRVIAENLHRNFIDHAEYPQTAEIEQRCIRMIADLFHAPGETTGARTQGSSEAIMLGALSLKWKWRGRREQAGQGTDRPNLVFGGDVHVVWEKFCRYFDVEPRIIPLQPDKYTIGPEDVEPHVDENTIGVAAVLGTTFTGHSDDIVGINDLLLRLKDEKGIDVPLHVDAASGGFVWPFLYPHSEWDFRLEQVRSINASGHKFGLVYPGIGWLVFRERSDLPEDLVFYENYLGKTDATFTLNFSTGSSMVLAQYYNFVRFGRSGYRYIMETMQANTRLLAKRIADGGVFRLIGGEDEEQLPLVAFQLAEEHGYDEFDVASQLAAERGWMVPAYTLPPNADHVKIMRALVKLTLGHSLVTTLADDIATACETLEQKGGLHELDRQRVKTGTGY